MAENRALGFDFDVFQMCINSDPIENEMVETTLCPHLVGTENRTG